jgi:hypothetical protein
MEAASKTPIVPYSLVKRVVRELVLWNILERTPTLTFQPDHIGGDRRGPGQRREDAAWRK